MSGAAAIAGELRSGGWAGGLPASGPGGDACAQIPGFAGLLLQYVQPLRELFDQLLGNSAEVAGFAATWEDSANELAPLAPQFTSARNALAELDGRTVRALRERYEDLSVVATDAAEWTSATAGALRLAARIVDATRSFVCDLLVRLSRFADELFSFTLNPFEAADRIKNFAESAYELVQAGSRLVNDLLEALFALASLIQRLMPLIAEALAGLQEIIAQMMPMIGLLNGGLVGMILGGAAENFLQKNADVEELDPSTLSGDARQAWEDSQGVTELNSLADLVGVNGTTDKMGGADASVIDIKRVVGPDGTEHWVVSLPSTQDWQFGPDTGALNDRDSNVALMLDNPLFKTVYERAVLEAMQDAGISPGDDVVLTGFSQGGIMAANLASDPTFPYNTIGVVTNGSPVDTFNVPSNIPVYAFQHFDDAVPMLDGNAFDPTPSNVHRVVLPPQGTWAPNPIAAHDNDAYTASVREWEQRYQQINGGPPPGVELFTGEVVDHSVFTAAEGR
ncbi:hypothetical protein GCM10027058_22470 [Microbacterium neimengense]